MTLSLSKTVDIIEIMENYIQNTRPPEDIRDQLDLGYNIEGQSIILFEIRPHFQTRQIMELPYAKQLT